MPSLDSKALQALEVLGSEVRLLRTNWSLFQHLYLRDPFGASSLEEGVRLGNEAYALMESAGRLFFEYARFQMLQGAILHVCRLTDRNAKDNLTLQGVLELVDLKDRPDLEWRARLASVEAYKEVHQDSGLWVLRNKKIAHRDFDVAVQSAPDVDPEVVEPVRSATNWIVDFVNILTAYRKSQAYEPFSTIDPVVSESGACIEQLIRVLRAGVSRA